MAFKLFEIGARSGKPISLYEFRWGNTYWRYTSADRDIEHGFNEDDSPMVWEAIPISDAGFTQGPQSEPLTITLPYRLPVCQLFRSTPPSGSIWMKVQRFHKDDPDRELITYWVGTIGNVQPTDNVTANVIGLPISSTMRRTGLRLCWERSCPYAVYDADCRADRELFKTDTAITAISGSTITVGSLGTFDGTLYAGGFVEWQATPEGTLDRRGIEAWPGGLVLNLFGTTDRLTVGLAVSLFIGCDQTALRCDTVFNNLDMHGGMEFLPGDSPFDGNRVF